MEVSAAKSERRRLQRGIDWAIFCAGALSLLIAIVLTVAGLLSQG